MPTASRLLSMMASYFISIVSEKISKKHAACFACLQVCSNHDFFNSFLMNSLKFKIHRRRRRERGDKSWDIKDSSLRPLRLCGEKKVMIPSSFIDSDALPRYGPGSIGAGWK
jgi:hypothetical protein